MQNSMLTISATVNPIKYRSPLQSSEVEKQQTRNISKAQSKFVQSKQFLSSLVRLTLSIV